MTTIPKAYTYKDIHQTLHELTRNSKCDYTYATTMNLLSDIPQQFEIELSLKDDKADDVPKVQSMMDNISALLESMHYGLFNLVATPLKDKVRGYFVASPTLTEAISKHKGRYSLNLFIAHLHEEGWVAHQQQSLRDISRYLSGGSLDSTATKYYTRWFKQFVCNTIQKECSKIHDVRTWVMHHSLNSESPLNIRQVERRVLQMLLQEHSKFVTRNKSFSKVQSYHQFIKAHT